MLLLIKLHMQKSEHQFVLKKSRNEKDLEHSIIKGCPIFETLIITYSCKILTQLLSVLRPEIAMARLWRTCSVFPLILVRW